MMGLKHSKVWIAALVAAFAAVPAWAELKVAVVDYGRLVEESPQAKAAFEAIRAEFQPRQREFQQQESALKAKQDKLEKEAAVMSPEQRSRAEKELRDGVRELNQRKGEAQETLDARRKEAVSRVQKTLKDEVTAYAKAQNLDLVIASGVIYTTPALDITSAIMNSLQARGPKPAAGTPSPATPKPASKPAPKP